MENVKKNLLEKGAIFTPSSDNDIENSEHITGFSFDYDYKDYLRCMGTIYLDGKEFYGLGVPNDYYLNIGNALQKLRLLPDYPPLMLPLVSNGAGAWFLYDCQRGSVFSWQIAGDVDDQRKSLKVFLEDFFRI